MQQQLTILSVDDDPDCRAIIREALLIGGPAVEVLEASCGAEALEFLARPVSTDEPRPDMICIDMEMPDMSGLELLKTIKDKGDLEDIPVVMVTGVDEGTFRRQALALGASGYVIKTSDPQVLLRRLLETMERWLEPALPTQREHEP